MVEKLADKQVRVHCSALGGVDLTSAAGKMTMAVISAVAEFERDLSIERTQAGLNRAKARARFSVVPISTSLNQPVSGWVAQWQQEQTGRWRVRSKLYSLPP